MHSFHPAIRSILGGNRLNSSVVGLLFECAWPLQCGQVAVMLANTLAIHDYAPANAVLRLFGVVVLGYHF